MNIPIIIAIWLGIAIIFYLVWTLIKKRKRRGDEDEYP